MSKCRDSSRETRKVFLQRVAREVRDGLISKPYGFERKVFLCGAAPGTKDALRDKVADGVRNPQRFGASRLVNYEVYYPEWLFDGLMSGPGRIDILTLENALASAVDAVVLITESVGAFTELGAFANHSELRKKLIVVQDKKFKTAKSFIRQGPIRLLEDKKEGKVLYVDPANTSETVKKVLKAVNQISRQSRTKFSLSNLLNAHHFLIPCLFLLESAPRTDLEILIQEVSGISAEEAKVATTSALSILTKSRLVAVSGTDYILSRKGEKEFLRKGRWERRTAKYDRSTIDKLRVEVLSRKRRKQELW